MDPRRLASFRYASAMLVACSNCGAPLDIEAGQRTAKCRYCKATSRTDALATVAPTTPPGWRPPPVWVPPAHAPAESVPLQYSADAGKTVAKIILFTTILGVIPALAFTLSSGTGAASLTAPAWDGSSVLLCSGDDVRSFSNLHAPFVPAAAIVASGNCQVTLTSCDIQAGAPIIASGKARVRLVGGTIRAGDGPAISVSDDAVVVLENGASAQGYIAVVGSQRGTVDARGGSLVGMVTLIEDARALQSGAASSPSPAPSARPSVAPARGPSVTRAVPAADRASSKPALPPGPCGCAPSDLMCAMKCSNSR
jgi:hypothetical protein